MPPLIADDATLAKLAARLIRCAISCSQRRYIVGIAGIPASGKSTLAHRLAYHVDTLHADFARLVPMDGFHIANGELDRLGLRTRKGAPHTFDADAYVALIRAAMDRTRTLRFPIYDRHVHEPVWHDRPEQTLGLDTRLVITEGIYLLLDESPWSYLADVLDECWWMDVSPQVARQRIIDRHIRGGRSADDAVAHFERSDLANTELILRSRREPDITLCWP